MSKIPLNRTAGGDAPSYPSPLPNLLFTHNNKNTSLNGKFHCFTPLHFHICPFFSIYLSLNMSHILQQPPPWKIFTPLRKRETQLVIVPETISWGISYLISRDINQVQAMLELFYSNRLCQHDCCILRGVNLLK